MAAKSARGLTEAMRGLSMASQTCREAASHRIPSTTFTRSMATEVPLPEATVSAGSGSPAGSLWRPTATVPLTIFDFPSFEPTRLESWSARHLHLPLRRDLLHLAVVYEGDNTRQGTASSKTRYEVRGSHAKIRPQKGTGSARLGTRQSPMLKGGGKTFGPKPRDFGTRMTRKAYDLAWRTALSYRYRRGELLVCADGMDLPLPAEYERLVAAGEFDHQGGGASRDDARKLQQSFQARWARQVLEANEWGRRSGRSTFITGERRARLFDALDLVPAYGRALDVADVDVKDLLETGRIVVERSALLDMLERHQSDMTAAVFVPGAPSRAPRSGDVLVE
ncbi:ribosomal protein L4/L1 family protein [Xylariaceae sp. FL0804]|nr:ribosomal protein L4/L1 family protein [Xylariaceae sp. FL0804]